jgi:DNA-binding transcriptional ArsR family regulator
MTMNKADLILHPARMQILQALAARPMNTQELAEHLNGVPKSSIYRHMRVLLDGGLVEIAEIRPVKGTLEKFYRLGQAPHLDQADLAGFSREDHMRYFAMFLASQLQEFSAYLEASPALDLQADRVGYSQAIFSVNQEQLDGLLDGIQKLVVEYNGKTPLEGSHQHKIAFITYPLTPVKENGTD